ncbi:arsenate reductase ArsC [Candidatus Pelagibacter sp.]|uniref:arsenate reductase ArsC n=1 Tax=Candidatus Pelagibacter sp. TaxID=2024849 RepID=UPI0023333A53|nr:arsenate reductase ArsC [Candidatus Pelagibacter sp.]
MKSILFVCTGNSARSIIAESIINNEHSDTFKAYSAGSNPSGKINEDIKEYLETVKKYNLKDYSSKNFQRFIDEKTKLDHVITVCNNANNEVCPIWPNKNQIDHWDIEDPVSKLVNKTKDQKIEIITKTFNNINQHINDWINFEK